MFSCDFRKIVTILLIGCAGVSASAVARAQTLHLSGRGGETDWSETPLTLPIKVALSPGPYVLEGHALGSRIPAFVFEDGDRRWLAAILPAVPARKPFAYDLKPQGRTGPGHPDGVRFQPSGSDLDVMIDDRLLTTYRPMSGSKPIFFPVIGPTGDAFTRAYPMLDVAGEDRDHPHQRSFWFTHGSVNGVRLLGGGQARDPAREEDETGRSGSRSGR